MDKKLFDSELKIMEVLWAQGPTSAKDLAALLKEQVGWSKTTTYTVIKKCQEKGALLREEPGFICRAAVSKSDVQSQETQALIDKLYDGSKDLLIASLLDERHLTPEAIQELRQLVQQLS